MHAYERVALWVLVLGTIVYLVFKSGFSGYESGKLSLMDLYEFDTLNAELKQLYRDKIAEIPREFCKTKSNEYSAAPPKYRTLFISDVKEYSNAMVNIIRTQGTKNLDLIEQQKKSLTDTPSS
jgi:hypothetical protein